MKLYIWNEPFSVDYGSSCLYVLASNEEEARQKALTATDAAFGLVSAHQQPIECANLGPPDRVIDGPYAEVYHWAE